MNSFPRADAAQFLSNDPRPNLHREILYRLAYPSNFANGHKNNIHRTHHHPTLMMVLCTSAYLQASRAELPAWLGAHRVAWPLPAVGKEGPRARKCTRLSKGKKSMRAKGVLYSQFKHSNIEHPQEKNKYEVIYFTAVIE